MARALSPHYAQLQKAAEWYALLCADDATDQDCARWRTWLDQNDEHKKAWQTVEAVSHRFEGLREERDASTAALKSVRKLRGSRRQALGILGIALGAGVLTAMPWRHASLFDSVLAWRSDYHTDIGEVREFELEDGTHVWLNTASALNVDYRKDTRHLQLLAGEAIFTTGKDARPFIVESMHGRMRALGTKFSVRQTSSATQLAVYEHAVEMQTTGSATKKIIHAGQRVTFDQHRIHNTEPASPAQAAWSKGLLIAEDMPLRELITELGRYRRGHLGISPEIANLRIIGTYPIKDTDQALAMLEHALPVRIQRTMPWWVTVEAIPK